MSASDLPLLAVVSGADGFDTCYVSFKGVVAADGAIVGTPTVTSLDTSLIAITGEALNSVETVVNGVTHAAGELLTFVATAQAAANADVRIKVISITAKRKDHLLYRVQMKTLEN